MAEINHALAVQSWRVRVLFVSAGAYTVLTDWTLRRDGSTVHPITAAWTIDATTVELALGAPLLPGARYTVGHASSVRTIDFAHSPPPRVITPAELEEQGDPEAEAFGVDMDWLAPHLTPTRDIPEVRGVAALKHDLAAVAITAPGELVHRSTVGVGLRDKVNGTGSDAVLAELEADTTAAFLADDRVREATVTIEQSAEQATTRLRASVLTPQLSGESIDFTTRI